MDISDIRMAPGTEQDLAETPASGLLLAYAALLPMAAGAVASWVAPGGWQPVAMRFAVLWAGAVVCFLAGVRRGLSFRQPGGSTLGELASMFTLFVLGIGAILSPPVWPALALLAAAFVMLGLGDAAAARRGEAPAYFARLRPVQMLLPLASIAVLAARLAA